MTAHQNFEQMLQSLQSPKFQQLWPAQAYILTEYSDKYVSTGDLAIELPTGAGKTLIALLISEAHRREGRTAAILSANKTLARQMLSEAQSLRIPAVLMEGKATSISSKDKRAYQRASAVAIMNYWVYFNQNPVIDPASLLIMDDAHLAEHCLHSLYSVEIGRHAHSDLFLTLVSELHQRFPDYAVLTDALADDPPQTAATGLLSFIDQVEVADRLREIVDSSPYLEADSDLGFRWNRCRGRLREANIYLGLNSIWIRPYVYPLTANPHYSQVQQRVYMSATIGDPADLSRRLGVRAIQKIPVLPEFGEKTSGRRLILMNRLDEEDIPARLQSALLAALRIHPKSVWLCSSQSEAIKLQSTVSKLLAANGLGRHPTWLLSPLGDEIEQFKGSPNGHLFVAGRFDGMDFSAEQCRLVVVATLPRAINIQEDFISNYLRDSGFMKSRLNHRIIQALGRCNRSPADFGVYLLADRRFATHFGRESNRTGLPRNIMAEIDKAQDLAETDESDVVREVEEFLRQDFSHYDDDFASYLSGAPTSPSVDAPPDTSADEVDGWTDLFDSQNYPGAAKHFEKCWKTALDAKAMEIGALHGWHWAKALYLQGLLGDRAAKERALQVLEDAIGCGGRSSWFNRMRASLNRVRNEPERVIEAMRDDYAAALLMKFDDLSGLC